MSLYCGIDLHSNNHTVAIRATAHKLVRASCCMLKDQTLFDAQGLFG